MTSMREKCLILIPSYEPDSKLLLYVKELRQYGMKHIVIIDDGSGKEYRNIFQDLEKDGCVVLRHKVNEGKGAALKTGYQYVTKNFSHIVSIVTADADGQHTAKDVQRMAEESFKNPQALILGKRDFKKNGVPGKSYMGNRLTSAVFALLYGKYFEDTQTGLRAFGMQLADTMIQIKGNRFEYETQVLISCIRARIPILEIPIETIYENENKGTHFQPVKDSIRIFKVILSDFTRFFSSSILSAAVDFALAWLLLDLLKVWLAENDFLRIMLATTAARSVSLGINYLLNKNYVFQSRQNSRPSFLRYLLLCIANMLLSASGVFILNTAFLINEKAGKVICDGILFLINYKLQMRWVFRP